VKRIAALALASMLFAGGLFAQTDAKTPARKDDKPEKKEAPKEPYSSATFSGLKLRGIGPALTSGRVADLAVDSKNASIYYVASASGGVWKTVNHGTTFEPIFDSQPSYSIGAVTIDPNDSLVVWVGTGENNSQRSVSYGDGLYKSVDGGQSWENVGLKTSEHIGKIVVDPRNSDTVYVAAQGPLWASGGDRGLYKTTDGGKTWKQSLKISENTGVSDVVFDPRNPDILYAAAYQRRRHVWTLIDGGPESAIYKSRDAGATWKKLNGGLPPEDKGRIGLAISPVNPDTLYAIVEAARGASGFYRSTDAGASWEKRSAFITTSPQYYQKLYPDPRNVDRVYAMDTFLMVTDDGGATFRRAGETNKHVDNHALWIDPQDTSHLLNGCDGGVYESYDRAKTWAFRTNLPLAQFYRVDVDYALPFYGVAGGLQDNFSLGGPSRTRSGSGVVSSDWFVTTGGDGFGSRSDPEDPNIIYAQSQYGGIVRFDHRSGEAIDIQPESAPGEPALRFNWDAPLLISPHSHTRLYFAANRLFRSDDRGDSWQPMGPDLTRQIDRNKLKVMGKVWSVDAVAKNSSTSLYGNLVALTESPVKEGVVYTGSDDGLIQMTDDNGAHWRKSEKLPGIPENTYVSHLEASRFSADEVFASFDNHKQGDFKPYVLKSSDRGATWTSITGDLPPRGTVYTVVQDHVDNDLLFAGTEFGVFFTRDGGKKWLQLTGGMPTIAVRDIAIQRRENDLVLATFGRGVYILDDYSPLRTLGSTELAQATILLPVRKAPLYFEAFPLGGPGLSFQGSSFFTGANPPYGAVFTYYLKEELKSRRKQREDAEKKLEKEDGSLTYPTWDALRAEELEHGPNVVWTVTDPDGQVIRRGTAPVTAGLHRVAWDLRFPAANPTSTREVSEANEFGLGPQGPTVVPGTYTVTFTREADGASTPLGTPQSFVVEPLGFATLPAKDRAAALAFQQKCARLQRAALGTQRFIQETSRNLELMRKTLRDTPNAVPQMTAQLDSIERKLDEINVRLSGDHVIAEHSESAPPSVIDRMQRSVSWGVSEGQTKTQEQSYRDAAEEFAPLLNQLRQVVEGDLHTLETQMEAAGAPWTPGRIPVWKPE
jgi:photosystem II stability/assembly factor-like uncharacterized protein